MRRIRLRTILAVGVLAGTVGATTYAVVGPLAPEIAGAIDDLSTVALDSTTTAGLNLQALTVEGREQTNREDLLTALDLERGTPILSIDVTNARDAIESLPWVKTAKVERHLPGGVHVVLEEYEPYALWQRGERYTLVDRTGVEIVDVPGADQSLPLIVGPDAPTQASSFFDTVNAINPDLAARIVAAVRISGRRWNVHFDDYENGVAVRLPEDNVAMSWTRLADIERDYRILERDLAFIDMRVEGQLIVRINEHNDETISPAASEDIVPPITGEQQEI
jgi:cell division protein FtsQ